MTESVSIPPNLGRSSVDQPCSACGAQLGEPCYIDVDGPQYHAGRGDVRPVSEHPGVHHKDGPLAQVRQMAAWAEEEAIDFDRAPNRETLHKIARNLRAAADALNAR